MSAAPANEDGVRDAVAGALAAATPLEVVGAGSKRSLGRPMPGARPLRLGRLAGIPLYEPDELVMTALAGTPLAQIEARLGQHGQRLAFEPPDYAKLLGGAPGRSTIGGVMACNLSGPGRIRAGAARDHLLGIRAVSGRGELFKSGGRVVKNVTGYDMCKLLAGSFGTLAVMTELTFKALPAPEKTRTLLLFGLDDAPAVAAMTGALNGPGDVSAAAHLPRALAASSAVGYVREAGAPVTALRIEGSAASVAPRFAALRAALAEEGTLEELHGRNSATFWREVADAAPLADDDGRVVWRLSAPPAAGAKIVAALRRRTEIDAYYDWGGGLIWIAAADEDSGGETLRAAIAPHGGHALLARASADRRARLPVFQPQPPGLAGLTARIKDSFDPGRILNPGRMYDGL